jgi:hypothetical protein
VHSPLYDVRPTFMKSTHGQLVYKCKAADDIKIKTSRETNLKQEKLYFYIRKKLMEDENKF